MAACRWVDGVAPCAPYRTQMQWLDQFRAHLPVYVDDVAFDSTDRDSLAELKTAERISLVKRYEGQGTISTTDLIDRMLHAQTTHHLPQTILTREICSGEAADEESLEMLMLEKINLFSCGDDGSNVTTSVSEFPGEENSSPITKIVNRAVVLQADKESYMLRALSIIHHRKHRFPGGCGPGRKSAQCWPRAFFFGWHPQRYDGV